MYFMPFLDFRIVLRFEVEFNRYLAMDHNVRQGPMECRARHWPHQCRNNLLLWSSYWRISSISKDFKQKLNNCFTVRELFPIGRMAISTIWLFLYAAGDRSRCKILENFLFKFISHRTHGLYYFHLKSSRLEQNKTDIWCLHQKETPIMIWILKIITLTAGFNGLRRLTGRSRVQ